LERVREHAKVHARKAWGAPVTVDDSVRRSLSRPLFTPTNVVAKEVAADSRREAADTTGLPPGTMLAPTEGHGGGGARHRMPTAVYPQHAHGPPATPVRRPGSAAAGAGSVRTASRPASATRSRPASAHPYQGPPISAPAGGFAAGGATPAPAGGAGRESAASTGHIRKLEEEVAHLKETIGVLLQTGPTGGGSAGAGGGAGSASAHSRPPRPSSARPPSRANVQRLAAVEAEHAADMAAVEAVLDEKRTVEGRILELETAKRRLGAAAAKLDAATRLPAHVLGMPRSRPASAAGGDSGAGAAESKDGHEGKEGDGEQAALLAAVMGPASGSPSGETGAVPLTVALHAPGYAAAAGAGAASGSSPAASPAPSPYPSPAVTRAEPFNVGGGSAGDKMTIAARRAEEERRQREAEEAALLGYKFHARPIPESTRLPLFGQIMAKQEIRRKLKHDARFEELKGVIQPFRELTEHEEQMKARMASALARQELAEAKELAEGRKFKANPVPPTIQNPDSEYVALVARERDRPARVAATARALAASASLPPRMALAAEADKRKRREREARLKAEELAERRQARFRSNDMPDFSLLHSEYEEGMRETRKGFSTTAPIPFGFDSEVRKAAEAARRAARAREAQLATSRSMELRSRSGLAGGAASLSPGRRHSVGGGGGHGSGLDTTTASAFPMDRPGSAPVRGRSGSPAVGLNDSAFGPSPGRPLSASRRSVTEGLAAAKAPPAAMTRTVQLRMLEVQRRVREQQERERQAAVEDEAYERRVREATRVIAPIVSQLEAERNPVPLAWQTSAATTAATLAKEEFEKTARANAEDQRRRVAAAEARRPFLFMRTSMDVRREEARRSALIQSARAAGAPHSASWQAVATQGIPVAGTRLLTDEEAADALHGPAGSGGPAGAGGAGGGKGDAR
jgi:hypothetical protein